MMYVRDLEGDDYILETNSTEKIDLNGSRSISFNITSSKVNNKFIGDISEMWSVFDHDDVEHKVVYFKRKGRGKLQNIKVEAIPLFFDTFGRKRIYENINEHMTADKCFSLLFSDTGFTVELIDSFKAIQWEGFGKGDTRLDLFKKALNRYKAEFRISGDTIYLESQIGRDTDFMYRYRLNASEIEQEVDASKLYTYAKGYGDFEDGDEEDGEGGYENAELIREYTSPVADIIGIRDAPPIMDGRVTDKDTMDDSLKELVDESLKISVSASIYDLRDQGYKLAQPEVGDRIFLIDERIGFNEEVRVVDMETEKDLWGRVRDLNLTIGSEGLAKRHQSDIQAGERALNEIIDGKRELPYSVLDRAVRIATESLKSAETELLFENGIIAREKEDPNRVVLYNSKGLGISDDGGETFKEAITADGFVLTAGAIGKLSANHIQIGPETEFESGYDPKKVKEGVLENLGDFEEYVDGVFHDGVLEKSDINSIEKYINILKKDKAEFSKEVDGLLDDDYLNSDAKDVVSGAWENLYMKAYAELVDKIEDILENEELSESIKSDLDDSFDNYRDKTETLIKTINNAKNLSYDERVKQSDDKVRSDLRLTSPLPNSIKLDSDGITASAGGSSKYARLDNRGLYIKGGAILIDGGLPDDEIENAGNWNDAKKKVDDNKSKWDKASYINSDGTLDVSKLKGKLSDSQLESAKQWNNQGTYIDNDGVYTGTVVASQIVSGVIDTNEIKIQGGSGNSYTKIDGNFFENKGEHRRTWFNYNKKNTVKVKIEDGQIRARNDTQEWSLYFSDWGISTFKDGGGDVEDQVASGAIEFHSTRYHKSRGLTLFSGARLALETNGGRIYLNPNGGNSSGSGASVRVADENDNFYYIHAASFSQHSSKSQKRDIRDLQDDALEIVNSLSIKEYKRLSKGKKTTMDKWQVGILVEEAAPEILSDGESVDLYSYVNYIAKSVQELSAKVNKLEEVS